MRKARASAIRQHLALDYIFEEEDAEAEAARKRPPRTRSRQKQVNVVTMFDYLGNVVSLEQILGVHVLVQVFHIYMYVCIHVCMYVAWPNATMYSMYTRVLCTDQ